MANARTKQQFLYWKKHAQLLGRDVTEVAPVVAKLPPDAVALPHPAAVRQTIEPGPVKSMATSVTKMNLEVMGPGDLRSVISHHSRVSTVVSPQGEDLTCPPAPSHLSGHKYFPCPYCGIICPERDLCRDDWSMKT
ncbi:uncharacterized protein BCR38DRAFT_412317 [Pseudomassariella vexata]|uniref:Uncharacterized protein n=1 Tax=Pseudomassariella vexata TaxID=1141098 RepID=A0A1Y2DLJ3_9PEZI|nr:uncharacterized protein BCR38DRAFT_412317 [Pseudomassariella vexata]ORY60117.1 hypothetical protein BCR38DRAFT_412317 [Pseudomassariella vexata]